MTKEKSGLSRYILICIGLILIILITFLYGIFGNKKPEKQMNISVILYSVAGDEWESFQEGMECAEEDFPVNINTVVLKADATGLEQYEAMERELENGADGVILAVSDYKTIYPLWLEASFGKPTITVESGFNESTVSFISADNYEMGKALGEEILKDFSEKENITVALSSEKSTRDSVELREQGLRDALEGKATIIPLRVAINGEGADVAVGLNKESLLDLAKRTSPALQSTKIYGIGNTAGIVAALDQGYIEKIVFQDEFNMGYLAVETLVNTANNQTTKDEKEIEYYCVSKEELYEYPYEQLLFPIVE